MIVRMTRSQQMAVLDVIMEHMRLPGATEYFVDMSTDPPTQTTLGELLTVFSHGEIDRGEDGTIPAATEGPNKV